MAETKGSSLFEGFTEVPTKKELIFDLLAFSGTVAAAFILDWKPADIVWGAWIASLLTGMSFYFVVIFKLMGDKAKGIHLKEEEGSGPGCLPGWDRCSLR